MDNPITIKIIDPLQKHEATYNVDLDVENPNLSAQTLGGVSAMFEAMYIQRVIKRCNGDLNKALKILGISQATYYRKISCARLQQEERHLAAQPEAV